ncbi:MAG: glycosyltransferase [Mesorhizobium sp.]|nr:glycosyltransferase [Mesorhizobium sp.]
MENSRIPDTGATPTESATGAPTAARGGACLTVVLPCYNERASIAHVIDGLRGHDVDGRIKRIIVVDDDSPDGTAEFIKQHIAGGDGRVICLRRVGRQGLSSAVAEGILAADSEFVAVMDADGQHTAEDLFRMLDVAFARGSDIVIGSRFLDKPRLDSHAGLRGTLSSFGNRIARSVLGRDLTDPLTGFFLFRRDLFSAMANEAKRSGFKILLDFLYIQRRADLKVDEVQIDFRPRHAGASKLDIGIVLDFADQMLGHVSGGLIPQKFLGFAIVGTTGMAVHFLAVYLFFVLGGIRFTVAVGLATVVAMVFNFALNNRLTFRRNRLRGLAWLSGLVKFMVGCSLGAIANVGVAGFLIAQYNPWALSTLAGVIVGTVFNFAFARHAVWK